MGIDRIQLSSVKNISVVFECGCLTLSYYCTGLTRVHGRSYFPAPTTLRDLAMDGFRAAQPLWRRNTYYNCEQATPLLLQSASASQTRQGHVKPQPRSSTMPHQVMHTACLPLHQEIPQRSFFDTVSASLLSLWMSCKSCQLQCQSQDQQVPSDQETDIPA